MKVVFRAEDVGKCHLHKYLIRENAEKAMWYMEKYITRATCKIEFCRECVAYHIIRTHHAQEYNG